MADSTLRVALLMDLKGLNQNLNKAQTRIKAFSGRLKNIGGQLQTRLALPLIAAGGASIKMAADFDKSMTKIKTLVGVAGAEVDAMSAGVKQMANVAGVSSSEAAEALFFITSAGLRGSDAMAVLEASTKAAALGLGETATVADLATSALNAYGVENLSATGATDVLTAAVREGKLEASELAGAMGRTLPIASNMGVQFHEVGAAFAAMSRTGTNANEAATQLNAILMAIMKPTKQSAEAMEQLGFSSQQLRQQIKDKGLLSVFQDLKEASIGNAQAFEVAFGQQRALRGILDLTGASAATTAEIFNRMANTAGITSKAFGILQNSAEFKLRQGLSSLRNSFENLGGTLMQTFLPMIQNVIGFVQNLFTAFNNLDPVTKQIAIGMAAFAAVLPTILSIGGSLLGIFAALVSPIGLIAAGVAGIAYVIYKNWNEVLPVVVGLYNRFVDLYNSFEPLRQAVYGIKSAFGSVFIFIRGQIDQVINVFKTMWNLIKEFSEKGIKGSFGDVLEQGFEDGKGIATKAAEDIAKLFSDNYKKAIDSRLEKATVEGVQNSLTNAGGAVEGFFTNLFGGVGIKAPSAGGAAVQTPKKDNNAFLFGKAHITGQPFIKFMENAKKKSKELATSISVNFGEIGASIAEGLGAALVSGENIFGALGSMILSTLGDLIIQMGAAAVAASELTKTFAVPIVGVAAGLAAIALGGVLKAYASKMQSGGVAAFANGGIVSGPTLGLIGEYSGARSNPEVVAPLDKLRGMIGQSGQNVNVGGEFRIQGQDLVVALQRAERNRKRIL